MTNEERAGEVFWEGVVHLIDSFDIEGKRYFERFAEKNFDDVISVRRAPIGYEIEASHRLKSVQRDKVDYGSVLELIEKKIIDRRRVILCLSDLETTWSLDDIDFIFLFIDMAQRVLTSLVCETNHLKVVVSIATCISGEPRLPLVHGGIPRT